jgi:hypothetical protein
MVPINMRLVLSFVVKMGCNREKSKNTKLAFNKGAGLFMPKSPSLNFLRDHQIWAAK